MDGLSHQNDGGERTPIDEHTVSLHASALLTVVHQMRHANTGIS